MSSFERWALSCNPHPYTGLSNSPALQRSSTPNGFSFREKLFSVDPCAPDAQISPLVRVNELLALSGRIGADAINNLVANLKGSQVIAGLGPNNVRLTPEGVDGYSWMMPGTFAVDKSSDPSNRWSRAFTLYGNGPNLLSTSILSYSTLPEIDSQLRRSRPAFKDFDALCSKLELPLQRTNLQSSFRLSAELPAGFADVHTDSAKGTLEIDIECIGTPDLMVEWLPQHELQRVPPGWKGEPAGEQHHVSLSVPVGTKKADLILSFAEIDADTRTHEIVQRKPSVAGSARKSAPAHEHERWKRTGRTLGEGGQAQVFIVEDTRKEYPGQWALKELRNIDDPKAKERFGREVKAVQSLNHPNVLRIIHSDLAAERPYFVAEYCEGGSLQKIGASRYKGNMVATKEAVLPILDALVAAHKAGVIHRDVKPPNILIRRDGTPVIGDFGICFVEGGQQVTLSNEGVGSRNFIAPEMESGQHNLGEPSDRTDVYSLGKVIYWMLSGGNEFAREDYPSLADVLKDQRFEHVHRLLEQMVIREPAKRLQGHEVREKLEMTSSLVEGNFAPLSPSVGIQCRFCGVGEYQRFASYDAGDPSKSRQHPEQLPDGTSRLGLYPVSPGTNVRCLRCSHCGHVEWFQFTGIKSPTWWDK